MSKYTEKPNPNETLQPTFDAKAPNATEECERLLRFWRLKQRRWPKMMPPDPRDGAKWWVFQMQEPWDETSEPVAKTRVVGSKDAQRWITPYVDRVRANLSIFLKLSAERQRFVVAAREDGFWWRGEHEEVWRGGRKVWLFELVIEEYERQKQLGKEQYRQVAMKETKETLRKVVGHG